MKKYLVVLGLALALVVAPATAGAQTLANLQALIATLQAQIVALTAQLSQSQGSCKSIVARDLYFGDEDNASDRNITALQKYLEQQGYLKMPAGANYGFFGRVTRAALETWQRANGVRETDDSGFAYLGMSSRRLINQCSPKPVPIELQPSITITSPNGGETWIKGTPQYVAWQSSGIPKENNVTLRLRGEDDQREYPLYYANQSFDLTLGATPNDGSQLVLFPRNLPNQGYRIEVKTSLGNQSYFDTSDSYFKITSDITTNKPPVITGLTAPTTLVVGQTGTWAVRAYDPEGGALNYSIVWGDEYLTSVAGATAPKIAAQTSTFTHSYSTAAYYKITITVSDTAGQSAQTTATVQVGSVTTSPSIIVISPIVNQVIKSPVLVSGKSDTFEANVRIRIKDNNGKVLVDTHTTGGAWGELKPFSKSVNYSSPSVGRGIVEVFEESAKDGSEIDKVTVPVIFGDFTSTPSLKASLNVTVLNGGIQCVTTPCEFPLNGAQVIVYDVNKSFVGNQIVGSNGLATFGNLNPGTYTVYVSATGYTRSNAYTVGLVSGQTGTAKIAIYPGV